MIANGLEKNEWKVQPDTTVQVVDPHGIKPEPFKTDRNWNGILISLAIIFFVGIMISIAAFLLMPFQAPKSHGEPLTLDMVSSGRLKASPLAAQWLSDKELVYISESEGLLQLNIESGATIELISDFTLRQIQVEEFSVSPNRLFILITHNIKKGRLFKRTAKYSIYDLTKHHYYPLKLNKIQLEHPRYQHVQWMRRSMNGTSVNQQSKAANTDLSDIGSEIILVHKNDIYFMTSPHGTSSRITRNGKENEVFNGVPNIMNEEIMRSSTCLWPSPDGNLLAYVSFIDSKVEQIPIIKYGIDSSPHVLFLRYPTVTSKLPKTSIWVAKLQKGSLKVSKWHLDSPLLSSSKEFYTVAVGWVNNSKVWISEISRDQKTSHLMTCEGMEWNCSSIYINHSSGEISPTIESVVWLENWAAFPWPIKTSSGGWWYNHVALVGVKGKKHPSFTLEKIHVKEVMATDSSKQVIYLLGSELSKGTETQQLYSVSPRKNSLVCISCAIKCDRIWASLNTDLTYVVITCVGTYFPTMHLVKLSEPNRFTSLHTQPQLKQVLEKTAMPISIYKEISLSQSVHASVTLSLPPGWTKNDDSLFYPLVIQLLGFENYDEMDTVHLIGLQELLSSTHYIAHARIKFWGRDSSHIDDSIESKAIQMGNVIRNILNSHEFLDGSRISIWGWGSGASLALKLTELGIFNLKCVMAVNPVMDWKQYGSYWSERLLGSIYSEGAVHRYEGSNILRALDALNGTQIMLMQSTNDPLSHHSFGIARHLIEKRIYFQHIVYPNSGVALRNERTHVLKSFKTFIADHKCVKSFYN